ncbi:tetratricopeptide repeat protein [Flavobacterium sp. I3-2]|uniref:tetratricopeptide repeat protein n=1 Tax=Flavobacterium sp. I3-2 TaxID=2748319 RepID=UPI0015A7A120|nr:hypothetical protein [Flavobacterium sp. I3-2]
MDKTFFDNYKNQNFTEQSGLIRIRFIVNYKGETDRFRILEMDEKGNLGYRGWCRHQFFRDYKGAIEDFENLEKLFNDIGYSQNGYYHLQIVKAICYSALNEKQKAIEIIKKQFEKENYQIGLFDYYQLGVCYYQLEDFENA